MIRFYCRALPTSEPQLGLDYLRAIDRAGIDIRVCPLGPALLGQLPWNEFIRLFVPAEPGPYLNMVCVPPGFMLGHTITQKMIAPDPRIATERALASDENVYQPAKAVAALYTDGVVNVAVVPPQSVSLEEDEVLALRRYQAVFCPSKVGVQVLAGLKIHAVWAPPEPEALARLLGPLVP